MFKIYFCVILCIFQVQGLQYEGESCVSEGINGTCVKLSRCVSAVRDIKMKIHPQLCSFSGTEPVVCCTDCELVDDSSEIFVSKMGDVYFKTGLKAVDKCLEYITHFNYNCSIHGSYSRQLLDNNCHIYLHDRTRKKILLDKVLLLISAGVGGQDAYRGQYPHMALLGFGDTLETADWLCGGSVISERFILTAAHCADFDKRGPVRFVALGILKRSDPPETWQRYNVRKIIKHPKYKAPSKYHDIALLEVSSKITFSRNVLPACLQVGESFEVFATATGWGKLGPHDELADTLQVLSLQEYDSEQCIAAYPAYRNLEYGLDPHTQLCYGEPESYQPVDTCPGDSGGPLQISAHYGECIFNILGIVSFGKTCGVVGNVGVYTKVDSYVSWIEEIVWF